MFARLAKHSDFALRWISSPPVTPGLSRSRQVLLCRWRLDASGRPVCAWEVVGTDAPSDEGAEHEGPSLPVFRVSTQREP
jgi:hypothetical protein